MIERAIRSFLLDVDAIRTVVGTRVYAGFAPAGISGPYLILNRIAYAREYYLANELPVAVVTLQLDAYESTQAKAWDLWEAIRSRLSGYYGDMSYVDTSGDESTYYVHEATIQRDNFVFSAPADASDKWSTAYSSDWRISHTQPMPTHS